MRLLPLLGVAVLAGCSGPSGDPRQLLGLASQATLRVGAVSYDFRYRETDGEGETVRFDGSVLLERMKDSLNYRMRLNGVSDDEAITIVADGETVSSLDVVQRTIRRSSIFSAGGTLRAAALPAVMESFLKPAPFEDELTAESVYLDGADTVGGRPCDVVRVDYADDDEDSRWCFDAEKHLPLRLEWISAGGAEMLELSNLDVDPVVKPEGFTIEKPDGFTEMPFSLGIEAGSAVPDWSLREPGGSTISSAMLRGQVVVLDFWASWCPPCIESMAALQRLDDELDGEPVKIFGVQVLDTEDPVAFMETHGLRYGILLEGEDVLLSTMGSQSIPSAIIIDAEGRVVGTTSGYYGEGSHRYLRTLIESALARTASPGQDS